MIHKEFADKAKKVLEQDENVIGLAVAGSWITNEIDDFSDLDLIVVTKEKFSSDKNRMLDYAKRIGNFMSGFTGEHVGEPRLLICLYKNPLLHVDIKFLTLEEFGSRIETPILLLDKEGLLENAIKSSIAKFPFPDYQWIEDRFWTWIHYALLKIGRGEYLEAYDFFGFLRMVVFGPLLHIKNGNLPRGVRKVEKELSQKDFDDLRLTMPNYNRKSLLEGLKNSVVLYQQLRTELFDKDIQLRNEVEKEVLCYFDEIENTH